MPRLTCVLYSKYEPQTASIQHAHVDVELFETRTSMPNAAQLSAPTAVLKAKREHKAGRDLKSEVKYMVFWMSGF